MEIRVLNYFLMAAREENITRAAQLLHITQPTLSRQLIQLEEELGVSLFRRSNHNIFLTEEGMILRNKAQEIVDLAEKTKNIFAQKDEQIAGEIAIGCGEYFTIDILAKVMAEFQKQYPLVQFKMFSGHSDDIKERIESGILDFGVLLEPVDISKYEFLKLPYIEQTGVYTRRDSSIADKKTLVPKDMEGRTILIPSRPRVKEQTDRWLGSSRDKVNVAVTFNLLYNALQLAKNGMGDVFGIKLDMNVDGIVFVPFKEKMESGLVFVWKKGQIHTAAIVKFMEALEKYVESITADKN